MSIININLDNVQETLVSGTNIKTINGVSILGGGDLIIQGVSFGTSGQIPFMNGTDDDFSYSANFTWVNGTLTNKGSGSTAATTNFLLRNSSDTDLLKVTDDGKIKIKGQGDIYDDGATFNIGRGGVDVFQMSHVSGGYVRILQSIYLGSGKFITALSGDLNMQQRTGSANINFRNSASANLLVLKSSGVLNYVNAPTSATGLSTGDIWSDGGTLKIV